MADTAWKEVDTTTIQNCWKKSGILPNKLLNSPSNKPSVTPSVLITSLLNTESTRSTDTADVEIEQALSHLEEHRVLQHGNQMDINELLNPVNEDKIHTLHLSVPTVTEV
ncbi:hypothetical protein C0995_006612 [Termitomyces sp. Mi166|nr:hypothetical protein C0995_006612 [Termitomyces sp. Mi166\